SGCGKAPTTATATYCSSRSSRRAEAPATPAIAPASTARSAHDGLRPSRPRVIRPSRDEFRELASRYTVVPVWRQLLADFITPVAAFSRVVGDGPGFLLESVEHGERWARWSFI